ncbi:MAG: hypothetical protein FIB07_08285 [Candidatus Methanoperedens sp.]|nr:hypothetical protein [Candidatus Methanoperedens sp.]
MEENSSIKGTKKPTAHNSEYNTGSRKHRWLENILTKNVIGILTINPDNKKKDLFKTGFMHGYYNFVIVYHV